MRNLLTEVERIKQMIGLPVNEMAKPSEQYIKSIRTILSANNLKKQALFLIISDHYFFIKKIKKVY